MDKNYWKDNGIEKPQQIVVCAANRYDDVILCGARHWDSIMRKQANKMMPTLPFNEEQGFIDQFGDFLTRKEAMQIVLANGQRFDETRNGHQSIELYSEGLY